MQASPPTTTPDEPPYDYATLVGCWLTETLPQVEAGIHDVPWIKPAKKILEDRILPTPETKLAILKLTIERLTSEGYVYIRMDHFAREDDELAIAQREKTLRRNFQGYSTCGDTDIFAFGMSSISQAGEFPAGKGSAMKILIVDDREQNVLMVQRLLESQGHEGMGAENGVEALRLARGPDL